MKRISRESSEDGAALVEAALTLLMTLILLFAVFEAGRILNIQHTLTNAAREGARFSVLPLQSSGGVPTDTLPGIPAIQGKVQAYLDANGMGGATADIQVNQACCDITSGGCVSPCPTGSATQKYSLVTVTVPYTVISLSMFNVGTFNLRGKAAMRNEINLQ
jgi:Flp pilus assembly protein TadG